ncbi:MAG: glycosyltransferase family 4 protein [Bacteroidales bacterium]|jgi:glycosyltransferase involved in cell wall biosynthesis|nr:glycosyltransferase family 4 protein [Bacteroidales bacterium]
MKTIPKPRILFVAPLPPPINGSCIVSQQIKDSTLINEKFRCDWVNLSTSSRMEELGKNSAMKIMRYAASLFRMFCLLLSHRYSLCYLAITCHGVPFLKNAPFVLLCKLFRRKIIIHQHNKGMSADTDKWPYRWLFPLVYSKARVVLLSWHLYADIESVVSKENVLICPNGVGAETLSAEAHSNNQLPHLLFLSNLIESKGVLVLLDALKILVDRGLQYVCNYVGGETVEVDFERLATEINSRNLGERVHYLGRRQGREKEYIMEQSDVFVFPTYYHNECFPLVLLEAMQHALPCVTTNEGGIADIVVDGETGIICPQRDAVALADALQKLITDKTMRLTMGRNGQSRQKALFTEKAFEERMTNILVSAIAENKA